MSNKPSAKAIAKLNASILFPAIRSEIIENPSLFAIRGFFIFNITKKTVPMTEWYLLFQGFDAPAVVSQKRPVLPKAKRDEDPIPVAILQIEDSDLLNFMSGGLTGSRGIVSGRIKIAGAIELAEQLEQIFLKAKGQEKTLAYLEQKRGKSEKARARLSNPTSFSSSPPTSSTLSEHKPMPAAQSKVHDLARRFSAISKQSAAENVALGVPQTHQRKGSFGRTEGSKVSGLLNKFAEPKAMSTALPATDSVFKSGSARAKDTTNEELQQQQQVGDETRQDETVHGVVEKEDVEKEIESNLNVKESSDKGLQLDSDLVDVPLSNSNSNSNDELAKTSVEEPMSETIETRETEDKEETKSVKQKHQEKEHEVPDLLNDDDTGVVSKASLDAAPALGEEEESLHHRDNSSPGAESENRSA
ncbi:hypothetical protein BG015_010776 [Linnemannia schmuckeri]|uniref:SCP2 domain-containing protein n=2 Tax=Linnemannia TaxID=2779861 RepID=A0A9P5RTJ2_9FUNG|nr:hypothetical protein BG015_010776 [Linnemannia schmuckeri]